MAVNPRLASTRRARVARAARWAISAFAALGASGAVLLFPTSAGALVTKTEAGASVGIFPREAHYYRGGPVLLKGLNNGEVAIDKAAASFTSNGSPVLHSANTYAIYWDPQAYYHGYWEESIDGFMAKMGEMSGSLSTVFANDPQYSDSTNTPATGGSVFHGSYTDFNPYPAAGCEDPKPFITGAPEVKKGEPVCLTDAQVRAQLTEFIAQHSLPKGMGTVYYLLTPPGVSVCLDTGGVAAGHCSEFGGTYEEVEEEEGNRQKDEEEKLPFVPSENFESYERSFCSYHGAIGEGSEGVIYAMIPWTAGGAGDGDLVGPDRESDFACQDGGFEPFKKPTGEPQEKERKKPKTPLEEEEFAKKNGKEKREAEEAEELGLLKPHLQEPNQLQEVIDIDGDHDLGLSDVITNLIAQQQQDIVTDPLLNAWQDSSGKEVADECRNNFEPKPFGSANAVPTTQAGTLYNQTYGGKNYYIQDGFNMAGMRLPYPSVICDQGVANLPVFTAPNTVNSGELVGFNGMESTLYLNSTLVFPAKTLTYPTYTWNFGDGSPEVSGFAPPSPSENSPSNTPCAAPWLSPCAASAFHAYQYGGTYQVTLTVKDVGGHVSSVTHLLTVVGPLPPAAAGSGSGSVAGGSGVGGSGSKPGSGAHHAPVATAAILSHSLRRALRSGILIRFIVNEALAGHVEVMIAASIAKRMHVTGAKAVGLPAGTPPQTIVAKSVLIAARGGSGTLTLHVGTKTAQRLHKLHSASFLMRLIVHNAGGTVTVLAPATLAG